MSAPVRTVEELLAHREWVRSLATALCDDCHDAADVEQQTWLAALARPPRATGDARSWLAAVVRNWARRTVRGAARRGRRERAAARAETQPPSPDALADAESRARVAAAVLALPEPLRAAVLLRYFDGLPVREVARRCGTPLETTRSRLRLARARLRADLGDGRDADVRLGAAFVAAVGARSTSPTACAVAGAAAVTTATAQRLAIAAAVIVAAGGSFLVGASVQRERDAADALALRDRVAALETALATKPSAPQPVSSDRALRAEIARLTAQVEALEGRAAAATSPPARLAPEDAAARAARAAALRAEVERCVAAGDGVKALAPLRDLVAIVPEGRDAAMELILALHEERVRLGVSEMAWTGFASSAPVTDLYAWALEHDAPEEFREEAIYSLAWSRPADENVPRFLAALGNESEPGLERVLVEQLGLIDTPAARAALRGIVSDGARDRRVRVTAATQLATAADGELLATLERAAEADNDATVRAGVRAALSARRPPATGFLVTGFASGSAVHPSGIEVGDVLVTYDGTDVAKAFDAAVEAAIARGTNVRVEVVRTGRRVALDVAPGWLGLLGRQVVARSGN